jgi:hypothetical protein
MFRRPDGNVSLMASINMLSYASVGRDPAHVNISCGDMYYECVCGNNQDCRGAHAGCCEPSLWASREWIYSPFICENGTVFALTHNEFHELNTTVETRCLHPDCSNWAITSHVSHDSGRTFQRLRPAPAHLVAAAPYRMPKDGAGSDDGHGIPGRTSAMGYWAPSNIAQGRGNGFFYSIIHAFPHEAQTTASAWGTANPPIARNISGCGAGKPCGVGLCVMRTRDLSDPKAWRAWGGEQRGWNVRFVDPYGSEVIANPAKHVCEPVLNMAFPSLLWSTVHQQWLVAGGKDTNRTSRDNPDHRLFDCSEIQYALSDDLIHWSEPYPIYHPDCRGEASTVIYPSLMDPHSSSANFDTTGATPYIYVVNRFLGRSIQRVPIELW